jgi:hypothetical protein
LESFSQQTTPWYSKHKIDLKVVQTTIIIILPQI